MLQLNVVCLWVGNKYSVVYVNNLYRMVQKYLLEPHRFVCLTDHPNDPELLRGIEAIPVDAPLRGWWHKVTIFRRNPYGLTGRILFLDLDVVVVGDLRPLLQHTGSLAMIPDFMREGTYNSSAFLLTVGALPQVWERFRANEMPRRYYGDQDWINHVAAGQISAWPKEWCVSYRLSSQMAVPKHAIVVCFHGNPKPHVCGGWVAERWGSPELLPNPTESRGSLEVVSYTWMGQTRYKCPDCGLDSPKFEVIEQHYKESHATMGLHEVDDGSKF